MCEALALTIVVTWDGNLIGPDGVVDAETSVFDDHEAIEVHVGNSESFAPDYDFATHTTRGDILDRRGGSITIGAAAGARWVRLVARSRAGKRGPASVATAVEVPALVDQQQFVDLENALVATQSELDQAQIDIQAALTGPLDAERFRAGTGVFDQLFAAALAVELAVIIEARVENLVVTEGALINEAVINKLAVQLVEAIEVKAENILTGNLEVLVKILTGALQVGNSTTEHLMLELGKMQVRVPGPMTEDGQSAPVVVTETGRVYTAKDLTSDMSSTLAPTGVSGPRGEFETVSLNGADLTQLLDTKGEAEQTGAFPNTAVGPLIGEFGYIEVQESVKANHSYRVEFLARVRGGSGATQAVLRLRMHESAEGVAPSAPTITTTQLGRNVSDDLIGTQIKTLYGVARFDRPDNREVRIGLTGQALGGTDPTLTIIDADMVMDEVGLKGSRSGRYTRMGGGKTLASDPLPPPPDPTPPSTTYDKTFNFTWGATYSQTGNYTAQYGLRGGQGGNSRYVAVIGGLPSALQAELASVTDLQAWLYLYHTGPHTSGTASIGWHNAPTAPASIAPTARDLFTSDDTRDWPSSKNRRIRLSATITAALKADPGNRGITIQSSAVSNLNLMEFIRTVDNRYRPKIQFIGKTT
ncbi:MAG: hypothetical protein M3Q39_09745 [Actinomycetota bacterium]|nr:hypothetical protein [Actinomycetota bacterium]